jgi:hypothetical protein
VIVVVALALSVYTGDERVAQLERVIEVTRRTPPEILQSAYEQVALAERGACAPGNPRVRLECMIAAARKACEGRANAADCLVYEDVIVSNVLAEQRFVPTARRYELMTQSKSWRADVAREIRRIQAALAADLRLRTRGSLATTPALARAIDAYCSSSAFETGLSWQICASSLVWFIGQNAGASAVASAKEAQ